MKLRNLSVLFFAAACGGGGGDNPKPVDAQPPDGGGGFFPNSKNDVFYWNVTGDAPQTILTPQADAPDNGETPEEISDSTRFSGEMGIAGDHGDEYFERDTFLITPAAGVNELTIRLDWDDSASDHDFGLFAVPDEPSPEGEEAVFEQVRGTAISDSAGEFQSVVVVPGQKYFLWSGVYATTSAGGAPTLPSPYDFSVYADTIAPGAAFGACNFNEAADGTNDILSDGAPANNDYEDSAQTLTTGTSIFCGNINTGHFVPDADDPTFGIVDVDSFSLNVALEQGTDKGLPVQISLIGDTQADSDKLAAMLQVEWRVLNDVVGDDDGDPATPDAPFHQFFGSTRGFFFNSHGTLTATLPLSSLTDDDPQSPFNGMNVGPKSIAIMAFDAAAIPANIKYRLKVEVLNKDTRNPRLASGGIAEGNDN
jgi:hypothetical protein